MKIFQAITLVALGYVYANAMSAPFGSVVYGDIATEVEAPKKQALKPYPLKTCIVSENDLDSMGEQQSFVYEGQTIKVCCSSCITKFQKNPTKYLKRLEVK